MDSLPPDLNGLLAIVVIITVGIWCVRTGGIDDDDFKPWM